MARERFEERITFRLGRDMRLAIETYSQKAGVDVSKAIRELLRLGLEVALGRKVCRDA